MKWIFLSAIATLLAITNISSQSSSEGLRQQLAKAEEQVRIANAKADEAETQAKNAEAEARKAEADVATAPSISKEVELRKIASEARDRATMKQEAVTKAKAEAINAQAKKQEIKDELRYYDVIASAEENTNLKQYEEAVKNYREAIGLKPGNASYINQKISEIEKLINEPASLYIYRKKDSKINLIGLLGGNQYDILLDGVVICRSKSNWKISSPITISSFGQKTLSAEIDGKVEVQINIKPGGVYYLRSGINSKTIELGVKEGKSVITGKPIKYKDTKTTYTPILELVSERIGSSEYNKIK